MMILIFTMSVMLLVQIGRIWTNDYEKNLVSVEIQDPAIENYASTISVIRYFLYNNASGDTVTINGNIAVIGSTAYTDLSTICGSNDAYYDTESEINYIKDGLNSPLKLTYDLIFILAMLGCMTYIGFRTFKKLKIHRVPLFIRSNNISPWSYKQRFKLCAFSLFVIISSFFTRYNMIDLSKKWVYWFDDYSCSQVDSVNHASITLGLCILLPFIALALLQQFNEKLKYTMVPLILVNGLFMFVVVILAIYSYWIYFAHEAYIIFRILHALNIITTVFMFLSIWFIDKYASSEFDFYEEH